MFIRVPEAHSRSFAKAVSWRIVGSLDTFVISWVVTGQLKYAGMILGIETLTKIVVYYGHEQFWAWVPWWRSEKSLAAAGLTAVEEARLKGPRAPVTHIDRRADAA